MALTDYTSHPTDDTVAKVVFFGPQKGELPKYFADIADAEAHADHVNAEWRAEQPGRTEDVCKALEYKG